MSGWYSLACVRRKVSRLFDKACDSAHQLFLFAFDGMRSNMIIDGGRVHDCCCWSTLSIFGPQNNMARRSAARSPNMQSPRGDGPSKGH